MSDFNVRADSVNVEQIMDQIRTRISEKRGVDYTEQQIRDLAAVKLEKFLDPRGVRSDLLDQFRKAQPAYEPPELPNYAFEDATLFESHRAPIRWMRKLLMPLLKLLFNPNPLIQALHIQSRLNAMNAEREAKREAARRAMDQLFYELVHNLVVETTRTAIEVKNVKMRVESIASRLEFNERRARALESVVVYKTPEADEPPQRRPSSPPPQQQQRSQPSHQPQQRYVPPPAAPVPPPVATSQPPAPVAAASEGQAPQQLQGQGAAAEGPGQRSRRRRRRRGRRGGGAASVIMGGAGGTLPEAGAPESLENLEPADGNDLLEDEGTLEADEMSDAPPVTADRPAATPPVDDTATSVGPAHAEPIAAHAEPAPAPAAAPAHPEPAPLPPVMPDPDRQ
jgi:hypothetical protein